MTYENDYGNGQMPQGARYDGGYDPTQVNPVQNGPVPPYQAPSQPAAQQDPNGGKPKRGNGTLRSIVAGGVAGALATGAIVAALLGTGVIGGSGSASSGSRATSDSSAGQTISINASTEDATVAQAVAAKCLPSVVTVTVSTSEGEGLGSGVILDTDGNIITNYHVVEGAQTINVTIDGKSYAATLVGSDASSDIAVVHAEVDDGTTLTPMEIGDSSSLVVGDWVMTIGSPLGLEQSVADGIVSALYRSTLSQSANGNTIYTNLIQTNAAINQGNPGGALVNDKGQLVGINTLLASETESFSGIGLAIPGNYAVELAQKIIAGETITHAYLGVSVQTVNAYNAQTNHLSVNQGAYVAGVATGGAAEQAGLQEGDIITKVDDTDVDSADGLILAVRSHNVGDQVTVTYMRGSEEQTTQVTLGSDEGVTSSGSEEPDSRSRNDDSYSNGLPYDLYQYFFENQGNGGNDYPGSYEQNSLN